MADQTKRKRSGWEAFSKTGVIMAAIYILLIILGFTVRLLFFSKQKEHANMNQNQIVSAQEGSQATTASGSSEATSQHILNLTPETNFVAVLEGNHVHVNVSMETTGAASADDLTWNSADESVATVDETGTITGVSKGSTQVTVSAKDRDEVCATIPVTVRHLETKDGCTYVDGILIVNKTYSLPESYDPGMYDEVQQAFDQLSADAAKEGLDIYIGSSYRDYAYQVEVYQSYVDLYGWETADTFSARPGYSEHQSGYTIDCNTIDDAFGETPESDWLAKHCAEYGFIVRFPEGKEAITGYKYEPWHIRYVGKDVAKEITALGVTLEEYLGVNSAYTSDWQG